MSKEDRGAADAVLGAAITKDFAREAAIAERARQLQASEHASYIQAVGGSGTLMVGGFRQAPTNLSFITEDEEKAAQELIDTQFREMTKSRQYPEGVTFREHARVTRYFCAVKLYVRPEELSTIKTDDGTEVKLLLPDTVRAEDRFQACVGLVVALGPDAFTTKDSRPRGSIYKVGDWVVFPRSDLIRIDFCGVAMGLMTDDRSVIVTDDPTLWTVGGMTFKA